VIHWHVTAALIPGTITDPIGYLVGTAVEKAMLHSQLGLLNQELEARVSDRTRELEKAKDELAVKARVLSQALAEERRVEEKTRADIARDLHDGVQQLIVGTMYEVQAATESVDHASQSSSPHLVTAQELLHRTELEMRRIYDLLASLMPMVLFLQSANAWRVSSASRMSGDLKIEGTPQRLTPEVETAAFRILQAAFNNNVTR
jgi:signal transduction histidine kinase